MAAFGKGRYGERVFWSPALCEVSHPQPLVEAAAAMRELSERCLHMDHSLSHHGTRPRSSDRREAAGPMGLAVDRVIPYGTWFAMRACRGHASHPMRHGRWPDCVHLSAVDDSGGTCWLTIGLEIITHTLLVSRGARSRVSMPGGAVLWQSCSSHRGQATVKRAEPQGAAAEGARTSKFPCLNSAFMHDLRVSEWGLWACSTTSSQHSIVYRSIEVSPADLAPSQRSGMVAWRVETTPTTARI